MRQRISGRMERGKRYQVRYTKFLNLSVDKLCPVYLLRALLCAVIAPTFSSVGFHLSALPAFNLVTSLSKFTCQWRLKVLRQNACQGSYDVYYGLLQQPLLHAVEESKALWLFTGPRIQMQNAECVCSLLVTLYRSLRPMPSFSYAERKRSPLHLLISIQAHNAFLGLPTLSCAIILSLSFKAS